MKIFGKSLSEYVSFAKVILAVIVLVGGLRLVLSLAGVSNDTVSWFSMSVVALLGAVYFGVQVTKTGFGGYRHLLPLMVLQGGISNAIAALGVALAITTGRNNIFTAPEYSGGDVGNNWVHVVAHIVLGVTVIPLALWLLSSLAMLVTKKLGAPRTKAPAGV